MRRYGRVCCVDRIAHINAPVGVPDDIAFNGYAIVTPKEPNSIIGLVRDGVAPDQG
jgi:hypothetical protein